ncbi:hypothetical protein [Streptomyces sp. NPDC001450]
MVGADQAGVTGVFPVWGLVTGPAPVGADATSMPQPAAAEERDEV